MALEPSHWRHMFRLAYASWGEARLQAAAGALALYPDFAFSHFQMAMVYVARAQLAQAETVLLEGLAILDRQSRRHARFPALGLEWLRGLIRLAQDDPEGAITAFDREEALTRPHLLYGREFTMSARLGRGCALLRVGRAPEAERALRQALEVFPRHAQSLLALSQALAAQERKTDARAALDAVDTVLATLARTRPIEARMMRVQRMAAAGQATEALADLDALLSTAPPGFAGWMIPIEPMLRQLHADQRFAGILGRLAERAR